MWEAKGFDQAIRFDIFEFVRISRLLSQKRKVHVTADLNFKTYELLILRNRQKLLISSRHNVPIILTEKAEMYD